MTVALPTYEQVRALPCAMEITVPDSFGDHNGHMNVRNYLGLHDDAGFRYVTGLGFGDAYIKRERRGFFDLEQHLRYHTEVLVGDRVAVHPRLLARSEKVVHVMSFLLNVTNRQLANTFEVAMAHVDLEARRTTPFRGPTAAELDRRLQADARLGWHAPTCGSIGVR